MLRLDQFDAVLLDLDGVLTDTASLHQAAWAAEFADRARTRHQLATSKLRTFAMSLAR